MCRQCLRFLLWTLPILIWDGIRLLGLVLVLAPGFCRFWWYYCIASNRKCVRYGRKFRQTLDVYCLEEQHDDNEEESSTRSLLLRPVVVFYTGGAWLIGYKMWGALLARALTAAGILVVIPDYRNYPVVSVPDMVSDVELSLEWILRHVSGYGGDANKIVLVGQSAGGHLACTLLLRKALENANEGESSQEQQQETATSNGMNDTATSTRGNGSNEHLTNTNHTTFQPTDVKGFISLSAPYHLEGMKSTFVRHGLDNHLIDRIFGGDRDAYCPHALVQSCLSNETLLDRWLPPIRIYHGSRDATVPHDDSLKFTRELQLLTSDAEFHSYPNWSHTDAILEGPMDADQRFHKDVFTNVQEWTDASDVLAWPEDDFVIQERLAPHFLIQIARWCNPF